MSVPYDFFIGAFLSKITEYDFLVLEDKEREEIVRGYLKLAVSAFRKNCKYDLFTTANDAEGQFDVEIADDDIDELVDIISEGMIIQWMKPYVYRKENLENLINTRDFTSYSPATILNRVSEAYKQVRRDYRNMIREYSYNHGDLTVLHL